MVTMCNHATLLFPYGALAIQRVQVAEGDIRTQAEIERTKSAGVSLQLIDVFCGLWTFSKQ